MSYLPITSIYYIGIPINAYITCRLASDRHNGPAETNYVQVHFELILKKNVLFLCSDLTVVTGNLIVKSTSVVKFSRMFSNTFLDIKYFFLNISILSISTFNWFDGVQKYLYKIFQHMFLSIIKNLTSRVPCQYVTP